MLGIMAVMFGKGSWKFKLWLRQSFEGFEDTKVKETLNYNTTTITEEQDLKDDSANFTIAMSYWTCIFSHMASNNKILTP